MHLSQGLEFPTVPPIFALMTSRSTFLSFLFLFSTGSLLIASSSACTVGNIPVL